MSLEAVLEEEFENLQVGDERHLALRRWSAETQIREEISERELEIDVEPEEHIDGEDELKLSFHIRYVDGYPDMVPELSIATIEGEIDDEDMDFLIQQLKSIGEENLGMAMTFTLVSHLREQLSDLVKKRAEKHKQEAHEKERRLLEEEEARTRGTPVTVEAFRAWKAKFDREMTIKKAQEEEEKLKGLSPKEREESKKITVRLSGRQLFERDRNLATSDSALVEEGAVSVDFSQYDRSHEVIEEEEERLEFSDSD